MDSSYSKEELKFTYDVVKHIIEKNKPDDLEDVLLYLDECQERCSFFLQTEFNKTSMTWLKCDKCNKKFAMPHKRLWHCRYCREKDFCEECYSDESKELCHPGNREFFVNDYIYNLTKCYYTEFHYRTGKENIFPDWENSEQMNNVVVRTISQIQKL